MDLHLHTPASEDFDDRSVSAVAIVETALSRGLDAIAVTDHNSGTFVDSMKSAAQGRTLTVFPGVEISCRGGTGGIHIIALLDPASDQAHVDDLLSKLDIPPADRGKSTALSSKEALDVVRIIDECEGLAVLAHANSTHGALTDMRGEQRTQLVRHPCVHAAEATDFQDEEKTRSKRRTIDFLDGNDPQYRRKLAVYQASDNPGASGKHSLVGIGTRCAFFKMDKINLEGLRQCFADPDVRIRQDFEYSVTKFPQIRRVKVTGGFLDGAEVSFHEGLNSVLGAKGAGKSLLVEYLRFALDQPPISPGIQEDHFGKLEACLKDYGSVEVVLSDETGKEFSVKRVYDPSQEHPYDGGMHQDLVRAFPVFFLSQNEILKIAETPEEQLAFIDRFFDFRAHQVAIRELERDLAKLDGELAESIRATIEAVELQTQVDTLTAELQRIDLALKDPAFERYARHENKDRALREQLAVFSTLKEHVAAFIKAISGVAVPDLPDGLSEDPALRRTRDRAKEAVEAITRLGESCTSAHKTVSQKALEEYRKWQPEFEGEKKTYEAKIQAGGGDAKVLAQKRAKTVKEFEGLSKRLMASKGRADSLSSVGTKRKEAVRAHRQAYEAYTVERRERCRKIEAETPGRLQVQLHEASNSEEFKKRLTALKKGSYLRDAEIDRICGNVDSGEFMRSVILDALGKGKTAIENVSKKASIDVERLRALSKYLVSEYSYEDLLSLEYMGLPQDRPDIRYNVGDRFEPLDRLSIGQKCTAMLLIALTSGTAPIVIDQPEDSLDLRSIWDDVCSRVRKGKDQRQFVFTTHSSSVAVATDTDKFVIMEADANRGRIVYSGSMDHQPVSDEALRYLEGGPPTYLLKFRKYRGKEIIEGDGT